MSTAGTLSALIAEADFNLRWFDLGRRVQTVSRADAEAFENGTAPWPHPYLRHAWTGLLLWPREGGEAVVWFLRLPLDEQGKLQLPVRDGFLRRLDEALRAAGSDGKPVEPPSAEALDAALQASGLLFEPAQERQASFHAHSSMLLQRPPSDHYARALAHLQEPEKVAWDQLALQGIADLAARWEKHRDLLERRIPDLAPPVFITLCQCLESEAVDHRIAGAIARRGRTVMADAAGNRAEVAAAVRGLSHSIASGLRRQFLTDVLESTAASDSEVLAAIGSRCADDLADETLVRVWLEAVSSSQSQNTFNLLMTDLMYLPGVRGAILNAVRDPQRPEDVARAFGNFLHGSGPVH
ncbi:DUF3549 domain-containing protein [Microbulbifer flavimaris]|uniref:DUF3549 domain-containing protein n=1 Tax=Microbulbifer flavimaris TaxID=1781068 RepID=A0ABX4HYF4_9GAMM|nr:MULTISPECIES: DUF3549 family protein [Microbulbifer]KUJ81474.1 hypothetical protein AVO43_13010 [Microbulbifer sp. ZGT114]PCO04384.1 DUF3549 domain-containing protein [Microbulbifer flavimaris]